MEPEGASPGSQKPATEPYPEGNEYIMFPQTLFP
jgi:hypothetical protein